MPTPAVQAPRGMRTPPAVRGAGESGEMMATSSAIADVVGTVSPTTHLHHQAAPPSSLASLPPLPLGEVDLDLCYGDFVSAAFNINGRGEFFYRLCPLPFFSSFRLSMLRTRT